MLITNNTDDSSPLELENNSLNADFNETIEVEKQEITEQDNDILVSTLQKSLGRSKRSPADQEGAGPSRENPNEVLENIRRLHLGFLTQATRDLITGPEQDRINQGNALRNAYRAELISARQGQVPTEDEVNQRIQEQIRKAISHVAADPNVESSQASVENLIVLFPEQFYSFLRNGLSSAHSLDAGVNSVSDLNSVSGRVRFAIGIRNYLVICAIPTSLREIYDQQYIIPPLVTAMDGENTHYDNQSPALNSLSSQRLQLERQSADLLIRDSSSVSSVFNSEFNSVEFNNYMQELEEHPPAPQVPFISVSINQIEAALLDFRNNLAQLRNENTSTRNNLKDNLKDILNTLNTISEADLIAYACDIQSNYRHINSILDTYIDFDFDTDIFVTYGYELQALYNRLEIVIGIILRRGILIDYATTISDSMIDRGQLILRVLRTRYSEAINTIVEGNILTDTFLRNFPTASNSNYPINRIQIINEVLASRHPHAIAVILRGNIITDYIQNEDNYITRDEHIDRVLDSNNLNAISFIFQNNLLENYIGDDNSRIPSDNWIHYSRHITRLLTLALPEGIELILSQQNLLIHYVNFALSQYNRNARINLILRTRNLHAIDTLVQNNILRNHLLVINDQTVINESTEIVLEFGSMQAIDIISEGGILQNYLATITDQSILNRYIDRILDSSSRKAIDILVEEILKIRYPDGINAILPEIRNYVVNAPDEETRHLRIGRVLESSYTEAIDIISEGGILQNYLATITDQSILNRYIDRILDSSSREAINILVEEILKTRYLDGIDAILPEIRNYVVSASDEETRHLRIDTVLDTEYSRAINVLLPEESILRNYVVNAPSETARDARRHELIAVFGEERAESIIEPPNLPDATRRKQDEPRDRRPPGSGSGGSCFPGGSGVSRSKRAILGGRLVLGRDCKITEEDLEKILEGGEENKIEVKGGESIELSEIKINSEKFLEHLSDPSMPDEKRGQLIKLAGEVSKVSEIKGEATGLARVKGLINRQKALGYLETSSRISSMVMGGMMWKNMLADLYNGNYEGAAINAAFIASGPATKGLHAFGSKLLLNGRYVLAGRTLMVGAPFLMQAGNVGFVVYDLVQQVEQYKQGNPDAIAKIVTDGLVIGLQGSEIAIQGALAAGLLEAGAFTAIYLPVVDIAIVVIFVGTDIYMVEKQVEREDKLIHLTGDEKLLEGLRHFVGIGSDKKLGRLLQEKQGNNALFADVISFLKNNTDIQRYVRSTVGVVKKCHDEREVASWKCDTGGYYAVPGPCKTIPVSYKTVNKCVDELEVHPNSRIDLSEKVNDIKWSRTRPDVTEGNLFCAPADEDDGDVPPEDKVYRCDDAMGIEYTKSRTDNTTYINLEDGHDTVTGFPDGRHVVVLGNGRKDITLGDGNDIFFLTGNTTAGKLQGEGGINTLDLGFFAKEKSIDIEVLNERGIVTVMDGHFKIEDIHKFLLRKDQQDNINIDGACNVRYVDARGGSGQNNSLHDSISISENYSCNYSMQLLVRPYTDIDNHSKNKDSKFIYVIPESNETQAYSRVNLHASQGLHQFVSDDYSLSHIRYLNRSKGEDKGEIASVIDFVKNVEDLCVKDDCYLKGQGNAFRIMISQQGSNDWSFTLRNGSDNTTIRMMGDGFYALHSTNRPAEEIIKDYSSVANHLGMLIIAHTQLMNGSNETIAIGYGNHSENLSSDPACRNHFVGNGGADTFVISVPDDVSLVPLPEVVLYDNNGKEGEYDILDLRKVNEKFSGLGRLDLRVTLTNDSYDLALELHAPPRLNVGDGPDTEKLLTVCLKDALITNWHKKRLRVILRSMLMEFKQRDFTASDLKPLPLEIQAEDRIYIYPDALEKDSILMFPEKMGSFYYRYMRQGNNLIISNMLEDGVAQDQRYFVSLQDYYITPLLQTLSIGVKNGGGINLKHHTASIAGAEEFSKVVEQYRQKMHSEFLYKNVTQESITPVRQRNNKLIALEQVVHYKSDSHFVEEKVAHPKETEGQVANKNFFERAVSYVLPIVGGLGGATFLTWMGHRYRMRQRLRANALPVAPVALPLLPVISAEAKSTNKEKVVSADISVLDKDRVMQMDECTSGARYGDALVTGLTCYPKNAQAMLFVKESDVKLVKPVDKLSKESCRTIEFNGRSSVYCEGEETNLVYSPEILRRPLDQLNDQLMLLYVVLNVGKKFYHWLINSSSPEKSIELAEVVPITTNQKKRWRNLLVDIEKRLTALAELDKVAGELNWVKPMLEDRKEGYQCLIRKSEASLEEVTEMTEGLKGLRAELKKMKKLTLACNGDAKNENVGGMEKEDIAHDLNPLSPNNLLLSCSSTSRIGFKPSMTPSFFKLTPQSTAMSLPVHAMNTTMNHTSQSGLRFIGRK